MATIACDVDDTVCDLMADWLRVYNLDYHDILTRYEVEEWDIVKFVKPECGVKIYDYLDDPNLYNEVVPIYGAIDGVNQLRQSGHRVVFVTSAVNGCAGRKLRWLQDWGFLPERRKSEKDYIECCDKAMIRADFLIDDGAHNLRGFSGKRILFNQPWNERERVDAGYFRAFGWIDVKWIINFKEDIQNG